MYYFSGDDTPQAWLLGLKTSIPLTGYGFGVFSLTFIILHISREDKVLLIQLPLFSA